MKKSLLVLSLSLIMMTPSFAGSIFDFSSKEDDPDVQQVQLKPNSYAKAAEIAPQPVADTSRNIISDASTVQEMTAIQDTNYKNAIQNIEAAQAGLREELINYNIQCNEIKKRYMAVKEEYNAMKKQIKATEKKIKSLEKTKENIGKNLTQNL